MKSYHVVWHFVFGIFTDLAFFYSCPDDLISRLISSCLKYCDMIDDVEEELPGS